MIAEVEKQVEKEIDYVEEDFVETVTDRIV